MRLWSRRDYFRHLGRLVCLLLVGALANESAHADPPTHVTLTLRISVSEKNSQTPIQNAQITIQRQGTTLNGSELKEIKIAIENGRLNAGKTSFGVHQEGGFLVREETDFQLTGSPHRILVTSQDLADYTPKELTDAQLQNAFAGDRIFPISVELSRTPNSITAVPTSGSPASNNANSSVSATPKKSGDTVLNPGPPTLSSQLRDGTNYAMWVLGVVIFSLTGFWLILMILARVFRKYSIEAGLLKMPLWLAHLFVQPFGFRLEYRLRHKTVDERHTPIVWLRNIHNSLLELAEPQNSMRTPPASLQNVNENLAKLAGSEAAQQEGANYLAGITNSVKKLAQGRPPKNDEQDEIIYRMIKNVVMEGIGEAIRNSKLKFPELSPTPPPEPSSQHVSSTGFDPRPSSQGATDASFNSRARAKAFYERFLDNYQSSECKPVYLEAAAKNSIEGSLADGNVYLSQVGSSQAPFILFQDDRGEAIGWVFPNPSQGFDKSTLKDVFPNLNEQDFNSAKQRIEPASVSKVGERRWRIVDL